jgi:hypothetical protein
MATKTDRVVDAAVQAAKHGKRWALLAAREADRLLVAARKRAESKARHKTFKQTAAKAGRVLRTAGKAALAAGVFAGILAIRAEHNGKLPRLPKKLR